MEISANSLMTVYEGWDGYQRSILQAVSPLTREQLAWRPADHLRSVGELIRHIALGRIDWFLRMEAPGSRELAGEISAWDEDPMETAMRLRTPSSMRSKPQIWPGGLKLPGK